jgi:hypothetical protein
MTVESGGTSLVLLLGALIGLVALAVLVFVGTLSYLRRQDDERKGSGREKARPAGAARRQASARQRTAAAQSAPIQVAAAENIPASSAIEPPALAPSTRQGEVMRVLRDPESSRVYIEVGGRRYEHIREIEDAQVGRRVLWAIADLIRFTGGMATNPRAVHSATQEVAWDEEPRRDTPAKRAAWSPPAPVLSGTSTSEPGPTNVVQTMNAFFRRGFRLTPSTSALPEPGSFIEQIEEILQARLRDLDSPLSHEVHVSAGPEQRLQIRVGSEVYGSLDEVPDPQVRALIQAAVDEWERR